MKVDVSIVVPMRNEADNAAPLIEAIAETCAYVFAAEIIVVDDGSRDDTAARVEAMTGRVARLRLLRHTAAAGQSAAVHSGVLAAAAPLVCTLDGDGQNPPGELVKLARPLLADGTGRLGLVAGQRVDRRDRASRRLASNLANRVRSRLLRDGTRDTGCGLKAFRRDAFLALPYFNHMHRYLPALFRRDGWEMALVDVAHANRRAGRSNYTNLQRAAVGLSDMLGVAWLIRRRKQASAVEHVLAPAGRAHG